MNENQVSTYNCFYFKPVVLLACMIKHILIKLATDFKLKSGFEQVMTVKKEKKKGEFWGHYKKQYRKSLSQL